MIIARDGHSFSFFEPLKNFLGCRDGEQETYQKKKKIERVQRRC